MRILLVAPGTGDDLDSCCIREVSYLRAKALFGPHAIATVAALTPPEHEVVLHDEHMRGPVDVLLERERFDVVGVNLTTNQFARALDIARRCKERTSETVTVAGGIGASNLLHTADHAFDVVFHGEAEETWPRFLEDLAQGCHRRSYQRFTKPDLSEIPTPRWDLIAKDIPRYGTLSIQTTRGCPHDCAFCDVIYTYGRTPRSKTVAQVVEEIRVLERLGASMVFVADDNFGGGKRTYAKELLRALVDLNNSFKRPLIFMTQVDILVSRDSELLELMADANFADLMIGIESINEQALREMNKTQNLRVDPLEAVRTIQSYGIAVLGHMIVGNDADDATAFTQTESFVERAPILHHFCHPLMAPPGTRVWYQFAREGRLVKPTGLMRDHLDIVPNIVPRGMTRVALLEGLADYWERVNAPQHFMKRALEFIANVTRRPRVSRPSFGALGAVFRMVSGVVRFYLFSVSAEHRRAFFTVMRAAARRGGGLVPRAIFLYTCYMLDYKRAFHDAQVARKQAAWERENPGALEREHSIIPLAPPVREHADTLLHAAYEHLCSTVTSREALYGIVIDAFVEFSDRYGSSMDGADDAMQQNLLQLCDRAASSTTGSAESTEAPLTKAPPAGFVRDILDAADSAVRVRGGSGPLL
jgi:radical SAM superfamily enzyme YgiQ (UPF0313 family)